MATAEEPCAVEAAVAEPGSTFKVYVGNLNANVDERTLREVFEEQGIVVGSILVKRSFAFVDCPDQSNVDRAIDRLNGHQLQGSVMQVEPSMSRRRRTNKVQIRNVPGHVGADQVEALARKVGHVEKCDLGAEGLFYITYDCPETAQQAVNQLNGFEYDGSVLKVDFASNKTRRQRLSNGNNGSGINSQMDMPLRILVGSEFIGAIIGRQGQTIRNITSQTRAGVDVHRREQNMAFATETLITIKGSPESCTSACLEIMKIVQAEAQALNKGGGAHQALGSRDRECPLKMLCPNSLCGRIIGKQGATINRFMEESGAHVVVSSSPDHPGNFVVDRIISITGPAENASKAEGLISDKMRKCYEQDQQNYNVHNQMGMYGGGFQGGPGGMPPPAMNFGGGPGGYGNFRGPYPSYQMQNQGGNFYPNMCPGVMPQQQLQETTYLYIPESVVGAVIGRDGENIKRMMKESAAKIRVMSPNHGKEGEMNGEKRERVPGRMEERKVVITGTSNAQWMASFYIIDKIRAEEGCQNHQDVHVRSEVRVPKHMMGRVIGKRGQNVKEMQRVSGAIVKTPDTKSFPDDEEVPVTVIGNFFACQSAYRRIFNLINPQQLGNMGNMGPPGPGNQGRRPQQNGN